MPIFIDFISYLIDAGADADDVTPRSTTRRYTRWSLSLSPKRYFFERLSMTAVSLSQKLGYFLCNCPIVQRRQIA